MGRRASLALGTKSCGPHLFSLAPRLGCPPTLVVGSTMAQGLNSCEPRWPPLRVPARCDFPHRWFSFFCNRPYTFRLPLWLAFRRYFICCPASSFFSVRQALSLSASCAFPWHPSCFPSALQLAQWLANWLTCGRLHS